MYFNFILLKMKSSYLNIHHLLRFYLFLPNILPILLDLFHLFLGLITISCNLLPIHYSLSGVKLSKDWAFYYLFDHFIMK